MWKPIQNFDDLYEISDEGLVRSVTRTIRDNKQHEYTHKGKILKPNVLPNGYLVVYLRKNGKTYPKYVHRLTAEAYLPNPNHLPIVNHKNGDKSNCKATNLEWSTYADNNQHVYDTGLHKRGEGHYKSMLTENMVREIRKNGKYADYETIGQQYGVSKATIRDVLLYRTWRHVV